MTSPLHSSYMGTTMISNNYDFSLLCEKSELRVQKSGLRTQEIRTQNSELIMCMPACYACMHMMHACILCMHTYNAHARAHAHKKTGEPQAKSSPDHRWGGAKRPPAPPEAGLLCILCMHAMHACILCMHAMHACILCMHAYYTCMHIMHACILCVHAFCA